MSMLPKPPVCPHCGNAEIARANLRLAAREKRMREVAVGLRLLAEFAEQYRVGYDFPGKLRLGAAKLLEGIEAE